MLIRIETAAGVPITRQIMDQIRTQCASGALVTGDRLPSVRELARQLAVNQNTILKVYERLTADGLLERRHGDGTFVSHFKTAPRRERELEILKEDAQRFVRRGLAMGISPRELRALVDRVMAGCATEEEAASRA